MKIILSIITAIVFSTAAYAQKDTTGLNLPIKDGSVVYERIVETPGKSKSDLYKNAKQWFVDYFKSSKDVIQNEDKEDGKIVGKGILIVYFAGALGNKVPYDDKLSIQIDCKDNKYRLRVYEQTLTSPASDYGKVVTTPEELIAKLTGQGKSPFNEKQARRLLESMDITIKAALASVNAAMIKKPDDF